MLESLETVKQRDMRLKDIRLQTSDFRFLMSLIRPRSLQVYCLLVSQSLSLPQQKRAARKGLLLLILIQLIQRLLEALGETSKKPVDFFHMKVFEFFSCRAIGFLKFWISIADFFGAFEEG